ncbi:MAG TPA: hypothetical protein VHE77_21715 [Dongiaceae bacterium]|nr:hypothetical protein [Dongiaceae bacterium]
MAADFHSASATLAPPPVALLTRWLNEAHRVTSGEARPASELCGEVAEFMGLFDAGEE